VDIWAVGVTLFEFMTGRAPFESKQGSPTNRTLYANLAKCNYHLPPSMPDGAKNLINKILVDEPTERLSLEAIRADPWILQQKDLVDKSEFVCE